MAPRSIHARNGFKREAISQGRDAFARSSTFKNAVALARSAERPFDLDHDTNRARHAINTIIVTCARRAKRRQFS